jgi:hypothetical protein
MGLRKGKNNLNHGSQLSAQELTLEPAGYAEEPRRSVMPVAMEIELTDGDFLFMATNFRVP